MVFSRAATWGPNWLSVIPLRVRRHFLTFELVIPRHNSSENICRESAAVPGASAEHEAAGKNKKWRASCQQMGLRFVSLCHESGGRMSQATTTFLDSLVHRSGGSTSDQARFRTFASQRLACANASGMAKLILPFNNHIPS